PNQWFFQTERAAMEQGGANVGAFVNSVNKYDLAFDRERDSLEKSGPRPALKGWACVFFVFFVPIFVVFKLLNLIKMAP
ncbi:hypothetical protein RA281_29120, partial [Pseudomonas syringae pv. tagetis]